MTSVTIVHRKDKLNKENKAPIHFRLIKNRRVEYIASGVAVQPHFWDKANRQVKKGFSNYARINAMLAQRFAEIQAVALEQETDAPKTITSRKIKQLVFGGSEVPFFSFADDYIEGYRIAGKFGTYDRYKAVIAKLKKYQGEKPLAFSQITATYLTKYDRYLKEVLKNSINTVNSNFKVIRRIFSAAFEQDLIELSANPFFKYKLKTEKTSKPFLTEAELEKLEELQLPDTKLHRARNLFVWACYAGGLRVSDLLLLKWNNYDGTYINFTIRKTNQQHRIKLPNKAIAILEETRKVADPASPYIFGCLDQDLDEKDPKAVDLAITRATAIYNKALKSLSKLAGIEKHLSSHISRHTFATRALRKGISLDKVQHILRHQNPSVTQIYAKLINEEVDKAMELFN